MLSISDLFPLTLYIPSVVSPVTKRYMWSGTQKNRFLSWQLMYICLYRQIFHFSRSLGLFDKYVQLKDKIREDSIASSRNVWSSAAVSSDWWYFMEITPAVWQRGMWQSQAPPNLNFSLSAILCCVVLPQRTVLANKWWFWVQHHQAATVEPLSKALNPLCWPCTLNPAS